MKVLLLLLLALPALAQVESTKMHWRDDLRWAHPEYDDANWIDADTRIDLLAHLDQNRYWVRLKVRVPDPATKPVIGLNLPVAELPGYRIDTAYNPQTKWTAISFAFSRHPETRLW